MSNNPGRACCGRPHHPLPLPAQRAVQKILACAPAALLLSHLAAPGTCAAGDFISYEECLAETLKTAADSMTASQVRQACSTYLPPAVPAEAPAVSAAAPDAGQEELSALGRRVNYESKNQGNRFTIIPHKPNYILLASYNDHLSGEGLQLDDSELDHTEVKFQLSFKVPLTKDLFGYEKGRLFAAYTMKSLWQAYNDDISSPFRETNHEPELFISLHNDWEMFGVNNPYILAGFSHQSNGRGGDRSRSWNRLYLDFIFERGDFLLSIKPWYRLPEESKSFLGDPDGDDNPDISSYMGYGELTGAWSKDGHTLSVMLRNNLRNNHNRGAVELGWSFPLGDGLPLKGYLQYFNGYGESLIDYNTSVNRIGVGVLLTDWL